MLIFCGDIHGDWKNFYRKIKRIDLRSCSIFLCGDVGIGFEDEKKEKRILNYWGNLLKNRNIDVYSIRGNHDDPKYFDNSVYGSIKLVSDYSLLNVENKNILCIGGAISVDRIDRNAYLGRGRDYWKDEVVKYDKIVESISGVDIVVSHTSPKFCYPFVKNIDINYINGDKTLMDELDKERILMEDIYSKLIVNNEIESWFYGHFHSSKKAEYNGAYFILLDINEFYEYR